MDSAETLVIVILLMQKYRKSSYTQTKWLKKVRKDTKNGQERAFLK
jgi:hypothetical protein